MPLVREGTERACWLVSTVGGSPKTVTEMIWDVLGFQAVDDALTDLFPSKDILVYTQKEAEDWAEVPNAMPTVALREGRVFYARPR